MQAIAEIKGSQQFAALRPGHTEPYHFGSALTEHEVRFLTCRQLSSDTGLGYSEHRGQDEEYLGHVHLGMGGGCKSAGK